MDNDNLSLIDPAFENIEQICRKQISEYLDLMPIEEKIEMCITSLHPQIPKTQEEVHKCIAGYVELYDAKTPTEQEELKLELIDICASIGIIVDAGLPLTEFQLAMRSELERKSNAQLLQAGIFGREITSEEIEKNRELIISGYLLSIQKAATDQALIQIGKIGLISSDFNYSFVADKFPLLVTRAKENILRRNLLN